MIKILLISILLSSCAFQFHSVDTLDLDEPIVIKSDTYNDILEKYGEPDKEFLFRNHFGSTLNLHYENMASSGNVIIKLEFAYQDFTLIPSNYASYYVSTIDAVWLNDVAFQNFYDRNNSRFKSKKTELDRRVSSEKLFEQFPDLWVVSSYHIQPD